MDVVVNDANILIDLYSVGLLEEFFRLPIHVHTSDFVYNEIKIDEQKEEIDKYIKSGALTIKKYTAEEIVEIVELQAKCTGNISLEDCSVWLYAKKNKFRLLTGDKSLHNHAVEDGVTVSGILYVFDCLVKEKIITPSIGAEKLALLYSINVRLPKNLIEQRINQWSKQ